MSRPYGRRPPYRRRDRLGFVCTAYLMVFGVIFGFALFGASAHAATTSPAVDICGELRSGDSLGDIETQLVAGGYNLAAAGNYAGTVVRSQCPDLIGWVIGTLT